MLQCTINKSLKYKGILKRREENKNRKEIQALARGAK
jgi:hypothetical protein